MPLSAGEKLGPYEVLEPIGAGGMGEVYKARDTRLDRLVALKVLSRASLGDADRKRRFLQEAKAASALNHPNIVTIHDVGSDSAGDYLAMELIAGKPLNQLIPRGGMPVPDLLSYGAQIADAFAKAHAAGIVHRDLKPANVMVTPEGLVKVLDFGLAKLNHPGERRDPVATETLLAMTEEGTVMGTAPYMSPEQAEAKTVDARSDIFSFGALLYEMATGRRAFRGDSQVSILAAVLREEPQATTELRPDIPVELRRLIARCLRKDVDRRAQSMADLHVALEDIRDETESGKSDTPAAVPPRKRSSFWLGTAAGALVAVILTATYFTWRVGGGRSGEDRPADPVPLTSYPGNERQPDFSPDGNQVVFVWDGDETNADLYVKLIGSDSPLRLTTDPHADIEPKWSPDGRNIAFLRRLDQDTVAVLLIPPLGGSERKLAQVYSRQIFNNTMASLCWTPDSRYLFVSGSEVRGQPNRILRLAIDSGEVKTLAIPEEASDGYTNPALSPDGSTLAMIRYQGSGSIVLLAVSKTYEAGALRTLEAKGTDVFSLAWTSDSRDLIASSGVNVPLPLLRISTSGGAPQALTWTGPGSTSAAVARQGRRMVFVRSYRDTNIWQVTLEKPGVAQPGVKKLASSSYREVFPQYSPDGKRLAFHSNRGGSIQIWTSDADGSHAVPLTSMDPSATTGTPRWSPDGQYIAFDSNAGGRTHLYVIKSDGGQPRALTSGASNNFVASWSHDGRWIYFTSNRTGRSEIWKIAFEGGMPEQVTRKGGETSDVSPDGKWLYFVKSGQVNGLWKMPIEGGEETSIVPNIYRYNFAVTPEGLYYVPALAPDRTSSVRYLNFATGTSSEVVKIEKPVDLGLAVSPDGRNLLFTELDYLGQDLMLVENFQ